MRGNTESKKAQRQQPLSSSSSPRAAAVTRWRQRPLSLSLSLSLTYSLYTTLQNNIDNSLQNVCPKSYLYIYDFSAYLHLCPSNRSVPIRAGYVMSRFFASSIRFHPEGHVSQQTPPFTPVSWRSVTMCGSWDETTGVLDEKDLVPTRATQARFKYKIKV